MASSAIGAVGSVAGGVAGGKGAKKAAKISAQTADKNREAARQYYNEAVNRYQPDINNGDQYSSSIKALLNVGNNTPEGKAASEKAFNDFQNSTGYQYMRNAGLDAVNANAYAKSSANSGATLKALQDRGTELANTSMNQYLAQLTAQQGVGQNAKANLTGAAGNNLTAVTNANNDQAVNTGNAAIASANNWINMLNNISKTAANEVGKSSYNSSTKSSSGNTNV